MNTLKLITTSHLGTILTQFGLLSIAPRIFAEEEFAVYLSVTALAWILSSLISQNSNEGLSFYLSQTDLKHITERVIPSLARRYTIIGVLLIILSCFLTLLLEFVWIKQYSLLIVWAILLTYSRLCFDVVYRVRAHVKSMNREGLYDYLYVMGVIPLGSIFVAYLLGLSIFGFLLIQTLTTALATLVLFFKLRDASPTYPAELPYVSDYKIFMFGVKRLPVNIGVQLFLGAPVLMAAMYGLDSNSVAAIGLIASIMRMSTLGGAIFTYAVYPNLRAAVTNKSPNLNRHLFSFVCLTVGLGAIISVIAYLISSFILTLITGLTFGNEAQELISVGGLTVGLVFSFSLLRPAVDALSEFPFTSIIVTSGIALYLVLIFWSLSAVSLFSPLLITFATMVLILSTVIILRPNRLF